MAKKDRDRERAKRQARWEADNKRVMELRRAAPDMKARLAAKGCILPFYDLLDSYEAEFARVAAWAKGEFKTLFAVVEDDDFDNEEWSRFGVPAGWEQVFYAIDDEAAPSYTARDKAANMRGSTTWFRDPAGGVHTLVQVVKTPKRGPQHKDLRYYFKLPVLLHELGHIKNFEEKRNFNFAEDKTDIIEAEVYAHLFSVTECYRRGYFLSAETVVDALKEWVGQEGFRGHVAQRFFERLEPPSLKPWTEYELD